MIPAPPALVVGAQLVLAVAEQLPTLDVAPGCRAAALALPAVTQNADVCIRSENNARDQLARQWSQFPAADRDSCTSLTKMGSNGTYTDLLTCLEIKRDARLLPKEPGLVGQGVR
jgi:hypothetical protein